MYNVLVEGEKFGMDSRQLLRTLGSQNIQCRPLWQPIHRSPAHTLEGTMTLPVSEELARRGLSLPCSVGLTKSDQDRVIAALIRLKK
jgi:perosamine synthetase